jgi:hypothetical protein
MKHANLAQNARSMLSSPPIKVNGEVAEGRWRVPLEGWVKANWDVVGGLLRDHQGNLIAAQSWAREGRLDPKAVQLFAAGVAIKTCKALGYTMVHFEGDAKVVVDEVNGEGVDRSRTGHLVAEIKAKLSNFNGWKFTFVQRNGNKVAHFQSD